MSQEDAQHIGKDAKVVGRATISSKKLICLLLKINVRPITLLQSLERKQDIDFYQLTPSLVSTNASNDAIMLTHGASNDDIMLFVYIDHTSKSNKWLSTH